MNELARGNARDEPTAAEVKFKDLVEERLGLWLDHYWWSDADGTPWMVLYLAFLQGPEGQQSLAKTLRLDFDSGGIRGGWSTGMMDWDSDLRAAAAGVDTAAPQGISMRAADHHQADPAQAAAG